VLAAVGALAADGEAPDAVDLYPEIFFPEAFLQPCRSKRRQSCSCMLTETEEQLEDGAED